jgi:hypothetical protein
MPLLNYTTEVSAERSVAEIQSKLAKAGAWQILHEYQRGTGELIGLSFQIDTQFGPMAFRLPANIEAVYKILLKPKSRRVNFASVRQQAIRVAWRILKDWIEAQLALIETGQVKMEQVFFAFVQDSKGRTLYEAYEEKKFAGLLMPGERKVVHMEESKCS